MTSTPRARRLPTRRQVAPYLLLAPGCLWLTVFFVVPNIQMLVYSLSDGTALDKTKYRDW